MDEQMRSPSKQHWTLVLSPGAALFVAAGLAGTLGAAASVFWMGEVFGVGRLRELPLLWVIRRAFGEAGFDVDELLPSMFHVATDFASLKGLAGFLCLATITNLLLHLLLAGLIYPAIVFAQRAGFAASHSRWGFCLLPTLLVGFALPTVFRPIYLHNSAGLIHNMYGVDPWKSILPTIAAGVLLWVVLAMILREPRRNKRLLAGGLAFCFAASVLALVGIVGLKVWGRTIPVAARSLPNVLLVSIDSLRADHLGCYGYPRNTSPTIDQLAAEGVRFTSVVASTSWTLPSHLTLLTALPPNQHGVERDNMRLRNNVLTLVEVLSRAGYSTGGFVSGHYLKAVYGYARGFDHYDDYSVRQLKPGGPASHRGTTSPDQLPLVQNWLTRWKNNGNEQPFFVFLHMWDVHFDYDPPAPYDSMFDPDYQGNLSIADFEHNPAIHNGMPQRDLEHIIALYDGEIRFTDFYIGKVWEIVRDLGVQDDTIVVITSDHGDEFFEHGNKGHGKTLYDETILIPLVIRYPRRVPKGLVVRRQVRLMDVAPTILSLAGIEQPSDFGGSVKGPFAEQDLAPLIAGAAEETLEFPAFSDLGNDTVRFSSIRTEEFKLIQRSDAPTDYELYDLRADPSEQTNLATRNPQVVSRLARTLSAWQATGVIESEGMRSINLTDDEIRQLRSLGYIQ